MIGGYKVFVSIIYCACLLSSVIFYIVAMNTDDNEGIGVWGAAISILATLVSGLALSILTIYMK